MRVPDDLGGSADRTFEPIVRCAREELLAGHYRAAIATLGSVRESDDDLRFEASIVAAHAYVRSREPMAAIQALGVVLDGELPAAHPLLLETRAFLAATLASIGDHAGARSALPSADETSAIPLRSELIHARAMVEWLGGDRETIEAVLAEDAYDAPIARARRASLRGWLCRENGDMTGFARLMDWSATTNLESGAFGDVGAAAASIRALAVVARELDPAVGIFERALELFGAIEWTSELGGDRFAAQVALSEGYAVRGNMIGSLSLANDAVRSAPSQTWHVGALVARAALRAGFGETVTAAVDLRSAVSASRSVSWTEADDEEQLTLLQLAEQLASVDRNEARITLARFNRLACDAGVRYRQTGGDWLTALRDESTGVVEAALGNTAVAVERIARALEVWERFGFRWRAARAALRLHEIDPGLGMLTLAEQRATAIPSSWVAADIADARRPQPKCLERMTPRQREVFRQLCDGRSVSEIAAHLSLSINTVRVYRTAVYSVCEVASQSELVAFARLHRLMT